MTRSTAALLAGYVHAAGVRHVFGYPGESVIDFMEAVLAGCLHEVDDGLTGITEDMPHAGRVKIAGQQGCRGLLRHRPIVTHLDRGSQQVRSAG